MSSWNYCVTFRIANKTVGGQTYDDRYTMLNENVRQQGMGCWAETTSFFVVESSLDTPTLTARVCKGLSAAEDMVLVFDPSDMSASYFGALEHVDVLRTFFPKLKKLG